MSPKNRCTPKTAHMISKKVQSNVYFIHKEYGSGHNNSQMKIGAFNEEDP